MILTLVISLLILFLKVTYYHHSYYYWCNLLGIYRDITTTLIYAIYGIEYLVDYVSYALFVVPYLFCPFIAYGVEGLFTLIVFDYDPNEINDVDSAENYLYSLILATGNKKGNNANFQNLKEEAAIDQCYL